MLHYGLTEFKRENTAESDKRVAHVIWAAHILSYLSGNRSHIKSRQPEDISEDEELEPDDIDVETVRAGVIQAPRDSVRSKFLDCIAQLLSPSKGWDAVTASALREQEDFVEVDVARNDCFGTNTSHSRVQHDGDLRRARDYCTKLQNFLSQHTSSGKFELVAIEYVKERVDQSAERLRGLLLVHPNVDEACDNGQSAVQTWRGFTWLLNRTDVEATHLREQLVQKAYDCVASKEVHELLQLTYKPEAGSKLWHVLKFFARPIMDCRMLSYIASQYPQFRQTRIFLIPPRPKTSISLEHHISTTQAWTQLTSDSMPHPESSMLANFDDKFKQDCAASYSLHVEMQLIAHYEDNPALNTSIPYFGCSKKSCLLCEAFLQGLPRPINTRGRHGICYPAWGVPFSNSNTNIALRSMEKMLVTKCRTLLESTAPMQKALFTQAVQQSTHVPSFSAATIQELSQAALKVKLARETENDRINERRILEGATISPLSKDGRLSNFEPEDSCIMCNKCPAKRCSPCNSSWYCSKACEKSDWPSHKLLCKAFAVQVPRPSLNHRRAIFFPEDSVEPQMIWLPCERKVEEDTMIPYEEVDPRRYLGKDKPMVGTMRIEHNPVRGRNLGSGMVHWALHKEGYSVTLKYREAFSLDGSVVNQSMLESVAGSGRTPHEWCGPIIAVRETPHEFYEDITLGDFRHIIDYLFSYRTTETRESATHTEDRAPTIVRGVKICCYGEKRLHGSEPFISVDVSRAHPTRLNDSEGCISPISELLGMSLKLWKYTDTDNWIDLPGWDESLDAASNPDATFLMSETKLGKQNWGWAPLLWNMDIGNVLAVRADDQDLAVNDVRMMCYFARRKLQPLFEDALGGGLISRTRQEVLDFITKENLDKCAEELDMDSD